MTSPLYEQAIDKAVEHAEAADSVAREQRAQTHAAVATAWATIAIAVRPHDG